MLDFFPPTRHVALTPSLPLLNKRQMAGVVYIIVESLSRIVDNIEIT